MFLGSFEAAGSHDCSESILHCGKMKEAASFMPCLPGWDLPERGLALIMCICLVSFCVHFNPGPVVLFAALHEGIIIEMYTANQSKALCLENLKAQINKPNPDLKPQVEV